VLDVGSGSLHQVDDATMLVLKNIQRTLIGASAISTEAFLYAPVEIQEEIRTLIDNGLLFTPDNENNTQEYMKNRKPAIKALCMHMAHECNLSCAYCFAGDGTYFHELGTDRGLMPLEVGKKALDFIIEQSGSRRNLEVDFFGGEPMLNFETVKALVAYGRQRETETNKKFRFTLTTNGALLIDEAHDYINQNFDNVVLSLDGRPHINDKMRKFHNGNGSYEKIYPKIKALADSRGHKDYYVRGTYTHYNLDFAEDVLHLADIGFKNISVEPVVAPPHADYVLKEEDLPTLFAEYEKLVIALLEREKAGNKSFFFHFEMDMTGGPCLAKRVTGCGAGSEYLAVTPSGKLYPCHQFVGEQKFLLGDVDSGIIKDVTDFVNCHVYTKPECANCWAKYYCSGGCMAVAYLTNRDIKKPDYVSCELQKKRIECALYMYAERNS